MCILSPINGLRILGVFLLAIDILCLAALRPRNVSVSQ